MASNLVNFQNNQVNAGTISINYDQSSIPTGYELDCNGSCNIVENCSIGGTLTIGSGTSLSAVSQVSGTLSWAGAASASSSYEYTIMNNLVILQIGAFSGTANTTASIFTTGIPAAITPSTSAFNVQFSVVVLSGSANVAGSGEITYGGVINLYAANLLTAGNFATTGNNGVPLAFTISYYIK